jgi:hypothetical protein
VVSIFCVTHAFKRWFLKVVHVGNVQKDVEDVLLSCIWNTSHQSYFSPHDGS